MILQPDIITAEMVTTAMAEIRKKKNLAALDKVRFEVFAEGLAAQTLYLWSVTEENPTIARVHQFIADSGHHFSGKHHEIYLSDIRKADPKKWKTVIRQPMR